MISPSVVSSAVSSWMVTGANKAGELVLIALLPHMEAYNEAQRLRAISPDEAQYAPESVSAIAATPDRLAFFKAPEDRNLFPLSPFNLDVRSFDFMVTVSLRDSEARMMNFKTADYKEAVKSAQIWKDTLGTSSPASVNFMVQTESGDTFGTIWPNKSGKYPEVFSVEDVTWYRIKGQWTS